MPTFSLSVPFANPFDGDIADFGFILEIARERADALDRVVYISMEGARVGAPNRWAVSPRGYLSIEGVQLPACVGCCGN